MSVLVMGGRRGGVLAFRLDERRGFFVLALSWGSEFVSTGEAFGWDWAGLDDDDDGGFRYRVTGCMLFTYDRFVRG